MKRSLPTALKGCRKIGLVGLGISNRGVLAHLKECSECPEIRIREKKENGTDEESFLASIDEDALVLSPSVRPDLPPIREARARGVKILSDCEIFFRDTKARCFAVTGSDGKSTTTAMLSLLLSAAMGTKIPAVGNIGQALTPLLSEGAPAYAIELSSFQLFHYAPRCERAVITNLSENHLNWHTDMKEYAAAKAALYEKCRLPAVCIDDIGSFPLLKRAPFSVYSLSESEKTLAKCKSEFTYCIKNDTVYENGKPLLPLNLLKADSRYNRYNLLAALALCAGLLTKDTAHAIENFVPLSHRCEPVGKVRGVTYLNSSIDSSPARTAQTLSSLHAPVILLLGGMGKGLSPAPLLSAVKEKCRAVIGFGPFGEEATAYLADGGYESILPPKKKMSDAFFSAIRKAKPGDTVLLSPGATSFDEFENFAARGEAFRRLVRSIQTLQGKDLP